MAIEIKEGWQLMPPQLGPPLPRSMEVYWPWVKRPPEEEVPAPPAPPAPPTLPGVPPAVKYRLYIYKVGSGTVTPTDGEYPAGSVITLTAKPGYGAAFDRWAGDAAGISPMFNITMDRNKTATAYFKTVTPPPYDEEPPPEEIPPEPEPEPPPPPPTKAEFYMPSALAIREEGPYNGLYKVTFSIQITNRGNAPGREQIRWGSNYLTASPYLPEYGPWEEEVSRFITIQPGESYYWSWTYEEVFDYFRGYFTCKLFGDWEGDNEAKRVWR
ncbi:hypothetical protein ES703_75540 [subsurface metagenome]